MKGREADDESLLRQLTLVSDRSAIIVTLIQLCRESPELCHWLWEDFGKNEKVRSKFAEIVKGTSLPQIHNFVELTEDGASWQAIISDIRKTMPLDNHGGLTWCEVAQLIRHYQAGTIDLGVFILAHDWRKIGKSTARLRLAGVEFLERIIPSGHRRLLKHLNRALTFLKLYEDKTKRRSALGYANRWKLHVLFYLLKHPRKSYTTRELRAHLATVGLQIKVKDVQRFCVRHNIRRDMRAGRPRKQSGAEVAAPVSQPPSKRAAIKAG